jgi:signal transduction histidine kinase/YHS domain-containing protein
MPHTYWLEICWVIAALFIVSNLWFYIRVLRPIRQLVQQATQLTSGKFDAFEQPCNGVAEIQQLRRAMAGMVGHVRRAQEQNRAYTEQLADGLEHERKRIARELHDDTVQSIIAVTQGIDLARNWVASEPERAAKMLQIAREQAVEIVNALRQLIGGLRPPALEELGLVAALKMHVDKIETLDVHLDVKGTARRLDEPRELTLFRTAQEALTNVVRHSGAAYANVKLSYQADTVVLTVRDDGHGFQMPAVLGDLAFRHHYGLLGIQERVNSLGGTLKVDSTPNSGTIVEVTLPVFAPQPSSLVRDPVCSTMIEPEQAYSSSVYESMTYYFCCPVCQGAFQKEPALYHNATAASQEGQ